MSELSANGRHGNPVQHPRLCLYNGFGDANCAQGSRKSAAATCDLCERHLLLNLEYKLSITISDCT